MARKPSPEMIALLKKSASGRKSESVAAAHEIAKALEMPLRQGILAGDITDGIFEKEVLEPGAVPLYPLDSIAPGTEKDFAAYSIPNQGYIPQRQVEADYIMIPTFRIANSIDWTLKMARDARWNIVARNIEAMEAGVVQKINDDTFHLLLGAGLDRNVMVYDADAPAGLFTKRLLSLGKTIMRRNAGGNSTSTNRGRLTDLYLPPEGLEDVFSWGPDQLDEVTRREVYLADDGTINNIRRVRLHDLDELGEDQVYQNYFLNVLGGTLASGDTELAIGLDLSKNDSFVMPIVEEWQTFGDDDNLHRFQKAGVYGWMEYGLAALDNRRIMLFSF